MLWATQFNLVFALRVALGPHVSVSRPCPIRTPCALTKMLGIL